MLKSRFDYRLRNSCLGGSCSKSLQSLCPSSFPADNGSSENYLRWSTLTFLAIMEPTSAKVIRPLIKPIMLHFTLYYLVASLWTFLTVDYLTRTLTIARINLLVGKLMLNMDHRLLLTCSKVEQQASGFC